MTRTKHSFEDKRVTKYNLVTRTAVLCVVCCFFLPVLAAYAEEVDKAVPFEVSVDPRVELMSILFRLAGNPEYNASEVRSYTRLVDRQFGPWRDHRAVRLAAQLAQRGAGFDAPMHLAIYLGDAAGLEPRIPIDAWTGEMAERWPRDETAKFLEAARDF
ncbi:MAG: hypothetical protein QG656_1862, partial [Candidatus Hydrogenedentes bacterium]|nr:hypothetical protein [Candidatus Hydrogenedentota bacterium]